MHLYSTDAASTLWQWSPYCFNDSRQFVLPPNNILTKSSLNLPGATVALIKKGARCSALLALHSACGVWVEGSKWLSQAQNLCKAEVQR